MFIPESIMVFMACIVGCGYTSYKLGHQKGIEAALEFLHASGRIDLETDEIFYE